MEPLVSQEKLVNREILDPKVIVVKTQLPQDHREPKEKKDFQEHQESSAPQGYKDPKVLRPAATAEMLIDHFRVALTSPHERSR